MSTAGEAASLFGAPDSSDDLFGEAIASNSDTPSHPGGTDPFSGQQAVSTDFFDTINSSSDTSTTLQGGVTNGAAAGEYGQTWMSTDQQSSYGQLGDGYSTGYSQQTYSNGWGGQQTQWSSYGQQQQYETPGKFLMLETPSKLFTS